MADEHDDTPATTEDGLPSDPAKRRVAVRAQFADAKTQLDALTVPDHATDADRDQADAPAAAWYRADLERVEADLLAVVRRHLPRVGCQLVAHALIETVGSVCADIVEAAPAARADIAVRLEQARLHIVTIGTTQH